VRPGRSPRPGHPVTATNVKATVPSGVLSLSTSVNGNLIRLTVVDTQAGNQPWAITASSGPGNVGLTGLKATGVPGNALTAANLTLGDTGLSGSSPQLIVADSGQADGTIGISGLLTFSSPASAGTVTITISILS
jgi:hypothetical protein